MVFCFAYNISNLFILKMDTLQTVAEVKTLHAEVFAFYPKEMAAQGRAEAYSKRVILCMDYIYNHPHKTIHVNTLTELVGLNRSYLSTLFKRETGSSVSEYILSKRMDAAQNMLRFSDYAYAEIAAILALSFQSHFNRVFRAQTGYTPKECRNRFFRDSQVENKKHDQFSDS